MGDAERGPEAVSLWRAVVWRTVIWCAAKPRRERSRPPAASADDEWRLPAMNGLALASAPGESFRARRTPRRCGSQLTPVVYCANRARSISSLLLVSCKPGLAQRLGPRSDRQCLGSCSGQRAMRGSGAEACQPDIVAAGEGYGVQAGALAPIETWISTASPIVVACPSRAIGFLAGRQG